MLFRVGETVTLANLPDRAHAPWGVIIGWDYFARGPPEWYSELTPAEKRQAHYLYVSFDLAMSRAAVFRCACVCGLAV